MIPAPPKHANRELVVRVRSAHDVGAQDYDRRAIIAEHMLVIIPKKLSNAVVSEIHNCKAEWEEERIGYKLGPMFENKGSESIHESDLLELYAYEPGSVSKYAKIKSEGKLDLVIAKMFSSFVDIRIVAEDSSPIPELIKTLQRPKAPTEAPPSPS